MKTNFTRKEVENYFGISIQSLVKAMREKWIKEVRFSDNGYWNTIIRISKSEIDKLESKLIKC